jgi:hypothetical protein
VNLKLRLSDKDRERLGCPEWLTVDLHAVTAREAAVLQRCIWPGPDGELESFDEPAEWRRALRGMPMVDATGAPVMHEVTELQDDGSTTMTMEQKRRSHWGANLALVWLALKANGVTTDPATLEYDQDNAQFVREPDPAEPESAPDSPGKGDGDDEPPTASSD